MKKLLLSAFAIFSFVAASAQFELEGRVYYDSTQTQLKEVYHYYLRYTVRIDPATRDTVINPEPDVVRHGQCVFYRQDGTIEFTGQYRDGKKSGLWLHYDATGKTVARKEDFG